MLDYNEFRNVAHRLAASAMRKKKWGFFITATLLVLAVTYFSFQFTAALALKGLLATKMDYAAAAWRANLAGALIQVSILALMMGEFYGWFESRFQRGLATIGHITFWGIDGVHMVLNFAVGIGGVGGLTLTEDSAIIRLWCGLIFPVVLYSVGAFWSTMMLKSFAGQVRSQVFGTIGEIVQANLETLRDETSAETSAQTSVVTSPEYQDKMLRLKEQAANKRFRELGLQESDTNVKPQGNSWFVTNDSAVRRPNFQGVDESKNT